MKPAIPALLVNLAIITAIISIGLYLRNPLTLVALFWLQPMPVPEYEDESKEDENYEGGGIGFTGDV